MDTADYSRADRQTLENVCVDIMSASTERRCVLVCVLARGAAASSGRGLWFIINNLYTPPTRC